MEIEAIIEDPRGSTVRHRWDDELRRWLESPHRFSNDPWPANYGYIPGTLNPADGEHLDVLVISDKSLPTGSRARIRPVGLLVRLDADDKILAALVGDPEYGWIDQLCQIPQTQIDAIEQWFAAWSEVGQWRDERAARERIREATVR